jgi:hypothetical protein
LELDGLALYISIGGALYRDDFQLFVPPTVKGDTGPTAPMKLTKGIPLTFAAFKLYARATIYVSNPQNELIGKLMTFTDYSVEKDTVTRQGQPLNSVLQRVRWSGTVTKCEDDDTICKARADFVSDPAVLYKLVAHVVDFSGQASTQALLGEYKFA